MKYKRDTPPQKLADHYKDHYTISIYDISLVLLVPHHGSVPQYEIEEEPVLLAEVEERPEVGDEGAVPVGGRDEAVVVELGGVVALHVDPNPDGVGAGLETKKGREIAG